MKFVLFGLIFGLSAVVQGQTVEVRPVDVIYGDEVYRGDHQVVLSSPDAVAIIPAEKAKPQKQLNVIVSADRTKASRLDEMELALREQQIYDEVNRRTEEAPFTVLFTGHIPEEIQQRRLSMMPEVGIFGDQADKLEQDQAILHPPEEQKADVGDFSVIEPGNRVMGTTPEDEEVAPEASAPPLSDEQKLEQLIGG